jgi:hypothetical protein
MLVSSRALLKHLLDRGKQHSCIEWQIEMEIPSILMKSLLIHLNLAFQLIIFLHLILRSNASDLLEVKLHFQIENCSHFSKSLRYLRGIRLP